jgi:hypothetical protein
MPEVQDDAEALTEWSKAFIALTRRIFFMSFRMFSPVSLNKSGLPASLGKQKRERTNCPLSFYC